MEAIKTRLIKVGNSRGVRIPKVLIDQVGLSEDVEIAADDDQLVIRSSRRPREGWAAEAAAMHVAGDDVLIDEPTATEFDEQEWKW